VHEVDTKAAKTWFCFWTQSARSR